MSVSHEAVSLEYAGVPVVLTAGVHHTNPEGAQFAASLEFAENARNVGVPLVLVDSSPEATQGTWAADAYRERKALVVAAEVPGNAPQSQQGVTFAVAHGAQKVVDAGTSTPLAPYFAMEFGLALEENDLLVVGRSATAEKTLPPMRRRLEHFTSWVLEKTLDIPQGAAAGVRGYTQAAAELFGKYPSDQPDASGELYLYAPLLAAQKRGLRLGGLVSSLMFPKNMALEEEGNDKVESQQLDTFCQLFGRMAPFAFPRGGRQADIAWVIQAHLPLLESPWDFEEQKENFSLLTSRLSEVYGYEAPEEA